MRADPSSKALFLNLVTTINLVSVVSVVGALAKMLEALRQDLSLPYAIGLVISSWFWPIELWSSSVWMSRRLLNSGRFNLAVLTAMLPLFGTAAIKILQAL